MASHIHIHAFAEELVSEIVGGKEQMERELLTDVEVGKSRMRTNKEARRKTREYNRTIR